VLKRNSTSVSYFKGTVLDGGDCERVEVLTCGGMNFGNNEPHNWQYRAQISLYQGLYPQFRVLWTARSRVTTFWIFNLQKQILDKMYAKFSKLYYSRPKAVQTTWNFVYGLFWAWKIQLWGPFSLNIKMRTLITLDRRILKSGGFLFQMREASAVLILANRHCTNPDAEDAANIMR
jgi:hypothetical protein